MIVPGCTSVEPTVAAAAAIRRVARTGGSARSTRGEHLFDCRAFVLGQGGHGALDQHGGGVAGLHEQPDARGCQLVGDSAAGLDEARDRDIRRFGVGFDVRLVRPRGRCDVRRETGRQPERCGQRLDGNVPQRVAVAPGGRRALAGVASQRIRVELLDLGDRERTPPLVLGTAAEPSDVRPQPGDADRRFDPRNRRHDECRIGQHAPYLVGIGDLHAKQARCGDRSVPAEPRPMHNAAMAPDTQSTALARLAGLLADETRASFCLALFDGRAWTAGELARHAGVARSTASEHLDRLVAGGLLAERRQGRHRYLELADARVAELLEDLMAHLEPCEERPRTFRAVATAAALANARTCYDHLAGRLGVAVTAAMTERGLLDQGSGCTIDRGGQRLARAHAADRRRSARTRPEADDAHLHRLDRAPAASRRRGRCRDLHALPRQRLGAAYRVRPGAARDPDRTGGAARPPGDP